MPPFTETQRFRQWWLWLILGTSVVVTVGYLWIARFSNNPVEWFLLIPMLLVCVLLFYWRLDTRLDTAGIHYRVFPLFSWRTIHWKDVQSVSVSTYGFVGYGIRLGFDGWVYNIAGNKGLRIVRKNKANLTIGTQRPDQMQAFLAVHYPSSGNSC